MSAKSNRFSKRILRKVILAISVLAAFQPDCVSQVAAQVETGVPPTLRAEESDLAKNGKRTSEGYYILGMNAFLQKFYWQAVRESTTSIEMGGNGLVYLLRGDAYFRLGEYEKAVEDYTHAISDLKGRFHSLAPKYGGDFDGGNTRSYIAMGHASRAIAYEKLKQYEPAIADLNEALAIQSSAHWLELRGNLYDKIGKSDLAKDDLNRAEALKRMDKAGQ